MTADQLKDVLFIAYYFPPVAGGGVQRSSKFVKYLPDFGWRPQVLTVREPYDFYRDDSLVADIPDTAVIHRSFSIEPMKWVRKQLKSRWQKEMSSEHSTPVKASIKPGFLVWLKTCLLVPDNEILWLPFAVWRGWRIIRQHRPQVIYSTASPYTDHLIGLLLSKISGLPWVADFRDPWVDRGNFPQNRWRLFIDRKLELAVLKGASRIVATTNLINENYRRMVPKQHYETITNGYDESDFPPPGAQATEKNTFILTYTGIFNRERSPRYLFEALKILLEKHPDYRDIINVRLIGQLDNPGDFQNMQMLRDFDLDGIVDVIPYQPHRRVIEEICRATALFLMLGDYPGNQAMIPGKLFEYLRAGKPILAMVAADGAAADVVRNTNSGIVVSNSSHEETLLALEKMIGLHQSGQLQNAFSHHDIEQFERRALTERLASIFTALSTAKRESVDE